MFKALINTNSNDILEPFQNLVETVIYNTANKNFTTSQITQSIFDLWGIEIPDMPLRTIVGRISAKGAVIKSTNRAKYIIKNREILKEKALLVENQLSKIEQDFHFLVNDFVDFTLNLRGQKISNDDAIREIESFINEQATYLALSQSPKDFSNNLNFSIYFLDRCLGNEKLSKITEAITFGYILSESIFIAEPINYTSFNNLNVVLDTPIIFKLLGINEIDERDLYEEMISDLIDMGAKVSTFNHCIDEMEQIIDGSIYYVDSGVFDPSIASETSLYFANQGYSRADIEEERLLLRNRISEFGIEVINETFNEPIQKYLMDENEIYQTIVSVYKDSKVTFYEAKLKNTLELDSRSINQIYVLRAGSKSLSLNGCKAVFLTSNNSLVYASKCFNDKVNSNNQNLIAPCIKDVSLATFLWLNKPITLKQLAVHKLTQRAYSIMTPNPQLWSKFIEELKKSTIKGDITEEQAYLLRTSSFVRRSLVKVTLKDLDNVTHYTPLQLIEELRNEGRHEAQTEFNQEINRVIEEKDNESKIIRDSLAQAIEEKQIVDNRIESFCRKNIKKNILVFNIFFSLLATIIYLVIFFLLWLSRDPWSAVVDFVVFSIPHTIAILVFLFYGKKECDGVFGKMYNKIENMIIEKTKSKYYN